MQALREQSVMSIPIRAALWISEAREDLEVHRRRVLLLASLPASPVSSDARATLTSIAKVSKVSMSIVGVEAALPAAMVFPRRFLECSHAVHFWQGEK
jgi:hypothetical protein